MKILQTNKGYGKLQENIHKFMYALQIQQKSCVDRIMFNSHKANSLAIKTP